MQISKLKRLLVGQPLSILMMAHERIPKWKALAVLSSDALSSVAYATEEILIPLSLFIGAGVYAGSAVNWSLPIAIMIGLLLFIITLSYRQTIDSYPTGGGAYIVAKDNLGVNAGLVAGASLLTDYVLTVAVSVAGGVANIASAFPALREHKIAMAVIVIFCLMIMNLRGVKDSASILAYPTYIFIASFILLLCVGFYQLISGQAVAAAPLIHESYPEVPLFLLLRAFSSGCSALTGVEAISNGITLFEQPSPRNAKITMAWMSLILGAFFIGMTSLSHVYGIVPKEGETAVSLLSRSVFGDTFFYYLVQGSTALILLLAANTSYADFPRLASLLAKDRFLPRQLASLGDRLVFSNGIIGLSLTAMLLIVLFHGDTHHLIPLYAIGVFLSFTLSQTGMCVHHWKYQQPGWQRSLVINALGALTTFVVLLVIASTKFFGGAWMVILFIPMLVFLFRNIHTHYISFSQELSFHGKRSEPLAPIQHTVVVPISGIHKGVVDALRYGLSISNDVRACYVELDSDATELLRREWRMRASDVPLVVLKSPFRSVISPLLHYIEDISMVRKGDFVTVLIPEFVTAKWYHQFLHNQTAFFIKAALLFKRRVVVTTVRYHLSRA